MTGLNVFCAVMPKHQHAICIYTIAEGTVDIAVVDLLKRKHSPMPDVTDTDTQSNSNFD